MSETSTSGWLNPIILDRITDGFFVVDRSWTILYLNSLAEMVAGRKREDVIGKHLWNEFPHLVGTTIHKQYTEAMESGKASSFEEFLPMANAHFETFLYPSPEGLSIYFRDISARYEFERQLKLAQSKAAEGERTKSRFLAHISHEVRSPMNGVLGILSLLEQTSLSGIQRFYTSSIRNSAKLLMKFLDDLLEFARMESGKIHLVIEDFRPVELVEQTLTLLKPLADEKNLELILKSHLSKGLTLRGDPRRIRQIILNLVGNSIKHTQKGFVEVSLKHMADEKLAHFNFEIQVSDSGAGIPKDALENIFEPFSQANNGKSFVRASGLGLCVVKDIAKLMNGSVSASSNEGQGSCFNVRLQLDHSACSRLPLAEEVASTAHG